MAKKAKKRTTTRSRKAPKARSKPPRGGSSRGHITFICSECYEDFAFTGGEMQETVTCPECLHVGKKPAEDFLRTVRLHKTVERKSLTLALAFLVVFGLAATAMLWASWPGNAQGLEETVGLVSLGATGLFFIVLLVLSHRYEKNRWEIYF